MPLKIKHVPSEKKTVTRLDLDGQLDAAGAPSLEQAVDNVLLNMEIKTLILNLSDMTFISSAGLRIFAKVRNVMKQRSGLLLLVNPQSQVNRVFKIVKTVPINEIYPNDAELDAYLKSIQ